MDYRHTLSRHMRPCGWTAQEPPTGHPHITLTSWTGDGMEGGGVLLHRHHAIKRRECSTTRPSADTLRVSVRLRTRRTVRRRQHTQAERLLLLIQRPTGSRMEQVHRQTETRSERHAQGRADRNNQATGTAQMERHRHRESKTTTRGK